MSERGSKFRYHLFLATTQQPLKVPRTPADVPLSLVSSSPCKLAAGRLDFAPCDRLHLLTVASGGWLSNVITLELWKDTVTRRVCGRDGIERYRGFLNWLRSHTNRCVPGNSRISAVSWVSSASSDVRSLMTGTFAEGTS